MEGSEEIMNNDMNRLTKKFNGEYYRKDVNTIIFNSETDYNAIQKLGKLEDIEDELGCPLDVVFRAIKCGIEFEHKITNQKLISKYIRIFYSQNEWKIRAYIEKYTNYFDRDLKDYQKTWWVKGEK